MFATVAAVAAYHGHWGFAPFWPFVIIGPLMFLITLGLVVALIVRRRHGGYGPWGSAARHGVPGVPGAQAPWTGTARNRSAEQILADRFATGDIDEVEYRARLEVLRANRPEA